MKGFLVCAATLIGFILSNSSHAAVAFNVIDMGKLHTSANSLVFPTDINALGDVVGYSQSNTAPSFRAFLYRSGVMTDLNIPASGDAYAYGLNDSGQICGYYGSGGSSIRGFTVAADGTITTNISAFGGNTWLEKINNNGRSSAWRCPILFRPATPRRSMRSSSPTVPTRTWAISRAPNMSRSRGRSAPPASSSGRPPAAPPSTHRITR